MHPGCGAATQARAEPSSVASHSTAVLATTILASSLAFVDGSVINVALPAIGRSLHADAAGLQWLVNAYLLPLSALLLLGGAAGDRFGRRRLLILGTLLFAAASVGCALSPSVTVLLANRLLQGVGSAMLMPSSLAILGQSFSGEAKGRAIGIWAASGAAFGAIGPVIGGWFIDLGGWRAIFFINVPLAAGAILLGLRFIPKDRVLSDRPLDVYGGVLATLGLAGLTWGLTKGSGQSGWSWETLIGMAVALAMLTWFVIVERLRRDRSMMPLTMFASASFVGLTVLTILLYGALGALFVLIPYVLIQSAGYTGTGAALALLPLPVVLSVTSPFIGGLAGRVGPRLPLAVGSCIVAAGFLLALRIDARAPYWTEVFPMILLTAVGLSGAVAPLTTAVLSSVDAQHTGAASGFNSAVARTGGLIATALLGSVLAAQGTQLVHSFHVAMSVSAGASLAAACSAFFLVENQKSSGRSA